MYGYENTTGDLEVWTADNVGTYLQHAEDAGYAVVWTQPDLREVQVQSHDRSRVIAQFARL